MSLNLLIHTYFIWKHDCDSSFFTADKTISTQDPLTVAGFHHWRRPHDTPKSFGLWRLTAVYKAKNQCNNSMLKLTWTRSPSTQNKLTESLNTYTSMTTSSSENEDGVIVSKATEQESKWKQRFQFIQFNSFNNGYWFLNYSKSDFSAPTKILWHPIS